MKQPGFQASEPKPLETSRTRRARGYHRPGRLLIVALLLALSYLSLFAVAGGLAGMVMTGAKSWGWLGLAGLGIFVLARFSVFMLSSALNCPLCHGPVMHERRCRKHEHAFRLWPLSYRASAVVSLIFTAGFRCMYCGTAWRLRRTSRDTLQ
jgi:hypothetical protein